MRAQRCVSVCVRGRANRKQRRGKGAWPIWPIWLGKFRNEHSEREILLELQKLGLKVFRLCVGFSTVRSYSPDNTNDSCATWDGGGLRVDEPP